MILSKTKIIAHFHSYQRGGCSAREEWPKGEHSLGSFKCQETVADRNIHWEMSQRDTFPMFPVFPVFPVFPKLPMFPMQKQFLWFPGSISDLQRLKASFNLTWGVNAVSVPWRTALLSSGQTPHCFVFTVSLIIRYSFIHLERDINQF